MNSKTVILANGEFPKTQKVLDILDKADKIICCDGAAKNLINYGLQPTVIIGDLDSLSDETDNVRHNYNNTHMNNSNMLNINKIQKYKQLEEKYQNLIIKNTDQNTNDLTKAVNWCVENKINDVVILGATGKREDHTIANIALLGKYVKMLNVEIITDYGKFIPITKTTVFKSFAQQQVSIFTLTPDVEISSQGLKYPLQNYKLSSWWMGTLNESLGDEFVLSFNDDGVFIVYLLCLI